MDLPQKSPTPKSSSNYFDPMNELAHITHEMYKKNKELNERNKTLGLLRKIDELVLSEVTDLRQNAAHVAQLLVENNFNLVDIFLFDKTKNVLNRLATSTSDQGLGKKFSEGKFINTSIALSSQHSLFLNAIKKKQPHATVNLFDILSSSFTEEECRVFKEKLGLKSIIVYPLIVRMEVIGILVIGLIDDFEGISSYEKDLIDRLAGVVGIALDNSLLYQSIQEANERLKQLDKLKDEFVSLASHELRTPMTIIKSYLWLFMSKKKGQLTPKETTYLERAYESTQRLINLVNDMLNVSRIESGRLTLQKQNIQIVELVNKVVGELMPRAQQLGLSLTVANPATLPPPVSADPERVEQVIINLVGNSLKFTPKGGAINVSIQLEQKDVLIKVADNGKGIGKEAMTKLFQKFATMGGSYLHKQEAQGTGLGLYLSKSLVEMQGGKMWAQSQGENKGSVFSFTLPFASS